VTLRALYIGCLQDQSSIMGDPATIAKLRGLPVEERLRLMEEVWESLGDAPQVDVPNWHRDELEARNKAHGADPGSARAWSEVKAEILSALGE
jgi:putative addiction module component (TIGR02574 family)